MSARDELREELVRPKRLGEYYLPEGAEDLTSRVRAEALQEAADYLARSCPEHSDADEVYMDCPCEWVDELRLRADAVARGEG